MSQNKASTVWKDIKPFAIRDIDEMLSTGKNLEAGDDGYSIILYDESTHQLRYYAHSVDGLLSALAASASGDIVLLPAGKLAFTAAGYYPVGVELLSGSVAGTDNVGVAIPGLTPGNLYCVETSGFYSQNAAQYWDSTTFQLCLDDTWTSSDTWGGAPTHFAWRGSAVPPQVPYLEQVGDWWTRVFFIAPNGNLLIRTGDPYRGDNGKALGYTVHAAVAGATVTIPNGVELVGLGNNSIIDGPVVNNGILTNVQVTGAISGSGVTRLVDSNGLEIFSRPLRLTVSDGTAPLVVDSATVVTSLNADMLDGQHLVDINVADLSSGAAENGQMLIADGLGGVAWGNGGAGTGDIVGPASAVDSHLVIFDGATGKLVRDGGPVPTGGGGSALDTKSSADPPDDEFNSTTLDAKWTVVSGASGTATLFRTDGGIYDLTSKPGKTLFQVDTTAHKVQLRQDYTIPDGSSIIACLYMNVFDRDGTPDNEYNFGISINSDDSAYSAGGPDQIFENIDNNNYGVGYLANGAYQGNAYYFGMAHKIYFRFSRVGLTYYAFISADGEIWMPLGQRTWSAAPNNLWIFCDSILGASDPTAIQAVDWIRLGSNNIDPW